MKTQLFKNNPLLNLRAAAILKAKSARPLLLYERTPRLPGFSLLQQREHGNNPEINDYNPREDCVKYSLTHAHD